jgi:nucleotide-binding universal stress UspA family protein
VSIGSGVAPVGDEDVPETARPRHEPRGLATVGAVEQDVAGAVVVVGVDGSEPSLHALRQATIVVKAIGGRIVLVYARQLPIMVGDVGDITALPEVLKAEDEIGQEAERDALSVCNRAEVPAEFIRCDGDPGQSIIDVAHEVDAACIVVGATIHGKISSLFLSSVAEYLLHHSDLSLVIVRPDPPENGSS